LEPAIEKQRLFLRPSRIRRRLRPLLPSFGPFGEGHEFFEKARCRGRYVRCGRQDGAPSPLLSISPPHPSEPDHPPRLVNGFRIAKAKSPMIISKPKHSASSPPISLQEPAFSRVGEHFEQLGLRASLLRAVRDGQEQMLRRGIDVLVATPG